MPERTWKCPATKKARYVAIGPPPPQWYVANPACRRTPISRPLETTCWSPGTVTRIDIRALSSGWSLLGNHHGAMCGSLTASASWELATQLLSPE